MNTAPVVAGLTSTTAPGKVFASRQELAEHYKSDWHKYNLKRREAGLPLLGESEFQARLEAAMALRRERETLEERSGKDHLKKNKKERNKKKGGKKLGTTATIKSPVEAYERMKEEAAGTSTNDLEESENEALEDEEGAVEVNDTDETSTTPSQQTPKEAQEPPEINPHQCLFDKHISATLQANVERMQRKYGFFIPDQEYLVDLEGLLGYCQEKIKLGHYCLYCQKVFSTWYGCQKHMISTRHTKLRYERGLDMEEFDPFYDFAEADAEFLGTRKQKESVTTEASQVNGHVVDGNDDDEDGWEDISDDEDEVDDDVADDDGDGTTEDEGLYAGYQDEIAKFGFDVTPLGELVFPDGRIIGHRGLKRYYKQRFRPDQDSAAVVAARTAAGERLYRGRVYNMGGTNDSSSETASSTLALARAGVGGFVTQGRAGSGVLVKSPGSGSGFTAVSLYRYKAVVKKARRDEDRGQRLLFKSTQNINRMDKKHNRLMNGVSVAHAAR